MGKNNLIRTSSSFVETKNTLNLSQINKNATIIDIRSRQAYLANHIINSINLATKDEILDFISQNPFKEYILCCMSSHKAAKLANEINMPNVKYYNGNILEAKDSGVEFISSDDNFTRLLNQTRTEILNKYLSYKRAFIIDFSGGKDSTVAGIIAEKAFELLNIDKFKYLYFNTSNDSADTYKYIKTLQKNRDVWMVNPEIGYYQWIIKKKDYFIPSVLVRNCCSTYKEGNLHKILNPNKRYIMILGLRKHESKNRSHYDYDINQSVLNTGKTLNVKPNWYRFAPIVEWTDEDVWLYILMNNLDINPMYKKGFSRVGCLICPQQKAIVDLLIEEYYPKQWKKWEDILTISYNKKGVEKRLKWSLDEWLQGKWKAQTSKEYEILKSNPTPNKVKELAQLKGISEDLAKKFFVKECVCCGNKVNPTDIAMSFKILGRKSENVHCEKCLKEKLNLNKKEYSNMSIRFREEGCELF